MSERRHKYVLYPPPDKTPVQASSIPSPIPPRGLRGAQRRGNPPASSQSELAEEITNNVVDISPLRRSVESLIDAYMSPEDASFLKTNLFSQPPPKSHMELEEGLKETTHLSSIHESLSAQKSSFATSSKTLSSRSVKFAALPNKAAFDETIESLEEDSPKPSKLPSINSSTSYTEATRVRTGDINPPRDNGESLQGMLSN